MVTDKEDTVAYTVAVVAANTTATGMRTVPTDRPSTVDWCTGQCRARCTATISVPQYMAAAAATVATTRHPHQNRQLRAHRREGATRSSPTRAGTPRGSPIPGATASPSASTDSPGGPGKNLVVRPQFGTAQTCVSTSGLNGPIMAKMNKPFSNGTFSVFVSNTNGTCGWQLNTQSDSRSMLAAVSRQLFKGRDDVTKSCLPGNISLLRDPVCMDKCVNIFYPKTGKTLTCPIEHQCADCSIDHVQLSGAAFRFLEPDAAIGTGTGARVSFYECILEK